MIENISRLDCVSPNLSFAKSAVSSAVITDEDGQESKVSAVGDDRVSFETSAGKSYAITGFANSSVRRKGKSK